ncbi:general secretion pathway protein I [Natronospira proteinivora]|uniref:Type II secretion system protein I n=2 Tax=Natronospira proteinivora TaxID=1807133 RepID=A0ABT1G966_9GAMM|nr:general secretion pathway protein I [Natronospira proteinivora]
MEVLVALAVIAIALTAILGSSGRTVSNAASLRDTTLAQWVAENRLSEVRLEADWPSTGGSEGETEMGGREWFWRMEVENTDDEDLRRLEVSVYTERDAEYSVATVLGFVGRPLASQQLPRYLPVPIPDEDGGPGDPGDPPPPPGGGPR